VFISLSYLIPGLRSTALCAGQAPLCAEIVSLPAAYYTMACNSAQVHIIVCHSRPGSSPDELCTQSWVSITSSTRLCMVHDMSYMSILNQESRTRARVLILT
jgi:hypothetical protein